MGIQKIVKTARMKTALIFLALVGLAACEITSFTAFKAKFNKKYTTKGEFEHRRRVFLNNLKYINKHNREAARGLHSYTLAVNDFADMTHEEFLSGYTSKVHEIKLTGAHN